MYGVNSSGPFNTFTIHAVVSDKDAEDLPAAAKKQKKGGEVVDYDEMIAQGEGAKYLFGDRGKLQWQETYMLIPFRLPHEKTGPSCPPPSSRFFLNS